MSAEAPATVAVAEAPPGAVCWWAARSRRPCDPPAEWAVVSRRVDAAGGAHAVAAYACSRHRAEVLDLIARRTATPIADGIDGEPA